MMIRTIIAMAILTVVGLMGAPSQSCADETGSAVALIIQPGLTFDEPLPFVSVGVRIGLEVGQMIQFGVGISSCEVKDLHSSNDTSEIRYVSLESIWLGLSRPLGRGFRWDSTLLGEYANLDGVGDSREVLHRGDIWAIAGEIGVSRHLGISHLRLGLEAGYRDLTMEQRVEVGQVTGLPYTIITNDDGFRLAASVCFGVRIPLL